MRLSPLVFLVLLAAEFALLALVRRAPRRIARAARISMFLLPIVVGFGLRGYEALATPGVLEWDETYYLSTAVTAAGGRGLYPYVFGYGAMPVLGGVGYSAYALALAVKVLGPTIVALRLVSLLSSLAALVLTWLLVKRWYGSGTAWTAAALTSTLSLFVMSNTARPDSLAWAWVMGSLLLFAVAYERWGIGRWHLLAGFVFGLGLQVHLDTAVTAVACGLLYLGLWLRDMLVQRRFVLPVQMLLYAGGWALGFALFAALNILPDPTAFYRTTVVVRVDATSWYSGGTSSAFGSFLNPGILLAKEIERYWLLVKAVHPLELVLFGAAVVALVIRRTTADRLLLGIMAGVVLVAAVLLNNSSPLYFIHVVPALAIPLAPLLVLGIGRRSQVSIQDLGVVPLLASVVVICALLAVNNAKAAGRVRVRGAEDPTTIELVQRVRSAADPGCIVAGDGALYVRYFADYAYFISTRPTEVKYAMLFYDLRDEPAYWEIKQPDVVFAVDVLPAPLAAYVARHRLAEVKTGVWKRPEGCRGGP